VNKRFRHFFRHRNQRILNNILRFGVAQACLDGNRINQLPIGIEELTPALLVLPIFQPCQKAQAGRQQVISFLTDSRPSTRISQFFRHFVTHIFQSPNTQARKSVSYKDFLKETGRFHCD